MSSDWPRVRLGDHIDSCLGKMLDKKKNKGIQQPYLGNSNVRWGEFDLSDLAQMKFEESEHERYGITYGDLIVCEGGEPGRCAIWKAELPDMKIQKALHRIRTKSSLNNRYLYYWFYHAGKHGLLEPYFTGTTIKHLTGRALNNLEIPLPPLSHQEFMAEVLGSLDDKIQLNHQTNQTLEQMAQAIFKSWFVDFEPVKAKIAALAAGGSEEDALLAAMQAISGKGEAELSRLQTEQPEQYAELRATAELFPSAMQDSELGEIPEGWEASQLGGYLDTLETGSRPKGGVSGITEGVPSVGAENIVGVGNYHYGKEKFVSVDFFNKLKRGIVEHLDCLLYKDGGKPGDFKPRVSMFGCGFPYNKLAINEHVFRLRSQRLGQPYLYFLIGHERVLADLRHKGAKAAIPGINQTDVKTVWTVCPPREVLDIFNTIAEKSLTSILTRSKESLRLSKLRDTLLPKLLSGELSVSDNGNQPSTEPLSPLQEIE
ncbi:restriction modification system DNA specificity domain [Marinobacter nauticus VT8]|uniref:Restriction modification system DNA specificity domain n=2 Tax=Marinobacter nauticus TaxID=2743 RepID=A1U634_MARN8|nr:restriction endonuclease subunit S [Marinobacter nauticus]ABM20453.1 restriction modification system DNA specificity domain [Marinobacter nauticus VT8]